MIEYDLTQVDCKIIPVVNKMIKLCNIYELTKCVLIFQ